MGVNTAIPVQRRVWEVVMSQEQDIAYQKSLEDVVVGLGREISTKTDEIQQLKKQLNNLSTQEQELNQQLEKVKEDTYNHLRFSMLRTVPRRPVNQEQTEKYLQQNRQLFRQLDSIKYLKYSLQQELTYKQEQIKIFQKEVRTVTKRLEEYNHNSKLDMPEYSGMLGLN